MSTMQLAYQPFAPELQRGCLKVSQPIARKPLPTAEACPTYDDLLQQIKAMEGVPVADPPLLFKVTVAGGLGVIVLGATGMVLGLVNLASHLL